jgi:hypothetical protein
MARSKDVNRTHEPPAEGFGFIHWRDPERPQVDALETRDKVLELSTRAERPLPAGDSGSSYETPAAGRRRTILIALVGTVLGAGIGALILTYSSHNGTKTSRDVAIEGDSLPLGNAAPSDARENPGAIGQAAPRLVGESLDGSPTTVSPGGGVPSALVFLAHWCRICRQDVREIVQLADRGELAGLDVTAVVTATSSNRNNYPPSEWLARERWSFPTFADNSDGVAANAYGVKAVPTIVLVDADGRVVARLGALASDASLKVLRDFAATR